MYISEATQWVIDVIQMQYASMSEDIRSKKITREQFDKYSYSTWAIGELLRSISEVSGDITVIDIQEMMSDYMHLYMEFSSKENDKYKRYDYCADIMCELIKLTGVAQKQIF